MTVFQEGDIKSLSFSKIEPLFERRTTIGKTFFNKMCHESNCLNYLLADKHDPRFSKNATPNMLSYSI